MSIMNLKGQVAVVAGASRGAGRGIACALGDAEAVVYVTGRSTRGGPSVSDGAPGTVEDTAEEVTRRGGLGIPVPMDCTDDEQAATLFERIDQEHRRLDILANAVNNAPDVVDFWGKPFWQQPLEHWSKVVNGQVLSCVVMARRAMPLFQKSSGGLMVHLVDSAEDVTGGAFYRDIGVCAVHDLGRLLGAECEKERVAVVTLAPGLMRTERVLMHARSNPKSMETYRFDLSESPEYVGRTIAALARDPERMSKNGKFYPAADLALQYGVTDIDGRSLPYFFKRMDTPYDAALAEKFLAG